MSDTIASASSAAAGLPGASKPGPVRARVWAEDEQQAAEAVDVLRHGLWPHWFQFQISEIERLPCGAPCPLHEDDPAVRAFIRRARWMWVLVPRHADSGARVACL